MSLTLPQRWHKRKQRANISRERFVMEQQIVSLCALQKVTWRTALKATRETVTSCSSRHMKSMTNVINRKLDFYVSLFAYERNDSNNSLSICFRWKDVRERHETQSLDGFFSHKHFSKLLIWLFITIMNTSFLMMATVCCCYWDKLRPK